MARKSTINEPQVSKAWEPPAGNTLAQAILVGSFAEGLEGVDVKALKAIESGLQIYMTRLLSDDLNDGITRDPRLPNIELYATTLPEIWKLLLLKFNLSRSVFLTLARFSLNLIFY